MGERDNRLYELRCSRKLSQGVVGDVLNLSQTRVSAYERGGSIPSEILKAFADFYGVTVDYILRLSDNSFDFRAVHRHNKEQNKNNIFCFPA